MLTETNGEIFKCTFVVGDFNIPLYKLELSSFFPKLSTDKGRETGFSNSDISHPTLTCGFIAIFPPVLSKVVPEGQRNSKT